MERSCVQAFASRTGAKETRRKGLTTRLHCLESLSLVVAHVRGSMVNQCSCFAIHSACPAPPYPEAHPPTRSFPRGNTGCGLFGETRVVAARGSPCMCGRVGIQRWSSPQEHARSAGAAQVPRDAALDASSHMKRGSRPQGTRSRPQLIRGTLAL